MVKLCPECGADMGEAEICEKCGYATSSPVVEKKETKSKSKKGSNPNWHKYESFVSELGKWAWIILLIHGIIYLIWGIFILAWDAVLWYWSGTALGVWHIISAVVSFILAIFIIKPRFSDKCASKDWDSLLNDVLVVGKARIPWMLIWGTIVEIFGQWWGGLPILIPALILIFAGPKPYNWSTE